MYVDITQNMSQGVLIPFIQWRDSSRSECDWSNLDTAKNDKDQSDKECVFEIFKQDFI